MSRNIMQKFALIVISLILPSLTLAFMNQGNKHHNDNGRDNNGDVLLFFNGAPQPNTLNTNGFINFPKDIYKFCTQNQCIPTTQFPLVDPATNNKVGMAYVWGANFIYGMGDTLCFTEVIKYDLNVKSHSQSKRGTVYTISDTGGTCGAFTDPTIVKPVGTKYGSVVVIAGGGAGTGSNPADAAGIKHGIVGATGDYSYLRGGSYVDRVFVEFSANNTITYYNALFFELTPPTKK